MKPRFSDIMAYLHNSGYGLRFAKPKIFCIGFDKCGTTSLHNFFRFQGLKSIQWKYPGNRFLGVEAAKCRNERDCKKLFSVGQCFLNFTHFGEDEFFDPYDMFPMWKSAFPDAYFIFNDRNVEEWILSRKRYKNGKGLRRYMKVTGASEAETIEHWRKRYCEHKKNVLAFFSGDPRFCHFMIGEDDISKIISVLAPDYRLKASYFGNYNAAKHP